MVTFIATLIYAGVCQSGQKSEDDPGIFCRGSCGWNIMCSCGPETAQKQIIIVLVWFHANSVGCQRDDCRG